MQLITHIKRVTGKLLRRKTADASTAPTTELRPPLPLPAIRPVMTALTQRRREALLAEDGFYADLKRMSN